MEFAEWWKSVYKEKLAAVYIDERYEMKTREDIINSMCFTRRHDYGLDKHEDAYAFEAGMTQTEREALYREMAQIFDNNIAPYMEFKK